jgi:SAM-dependent methyltransferase
LIWHNHRLATEPARTPPWLCELLGLDSLPADSAEVMLDGQPFLMRDGILRLARSVSTAQDQTAAAFGFKWHQRDSFESDSVFGLTHDYLVDRYGDIEGADWWDEYGESPVVLDAGCGAGLTAHALLGQRLASVRYLGADISDAVDVASARFAERGLPAAFIQADLNHVPIKEGSVHFALAEGTLHHTDSTETAFHNVARLLAPGGRFAFYIYRRKAPVREFTDDYIRDRLQDMTPDEAWATMMPLTKLGRALGELQVTVDVPEDIDLLGIPAGRHDVQRLVYWYIFKAYHRPEWTLEELNHVNYDWYAPRNAFRHTEDELRSWCEAAGLEIDRERVDQPGITIVARKPS